MKRLRFSYQTKLQFKTPIEKQHFTIKCIPKSSERQQIHNLALAIAPYDFLSPTEDSFGNQGVYGYCKEKHLEFEIQMTGFAMTGLAESEAAGEWYQVGMYRYQTPLTKSGKYIEEFAKEYPVSIRMTNRQKTMHYIDALYERFQYVQGITRVETTAEEAMALGKGVCQDYAQIMLSLLRREGIPCRYIVGFLQGEGESHAWIEIYEDGKWWAYDPTNPMNLQEEYIKISAGRDYRDCRMNQGVFLGNGSQCQEVKVIVTEEEEM